jgi:hypothetical protein
MMTNEEMEKLHTVPDVVMPAPSPGSQPPPVEASDETAPIGDELLAVLDAILGVGANE